MNQVVREQWRQARLKATTSAYVWIDTGQQVTYDDMVTILNEQGVIPDDKVDFYRKARERKDRWFVTEKANTVMRGLLGDTLNLAVIPFVPRQEDAFDFDMYETVTGNPAPGYAYVARREES